MVIDWALSEGAGQYRQVTEQEAHVDLAPWDTGGRQLAFTVATVTPTATPTNTPSPTPTATPTPQEVPPFDHELDHVYVYPDDVTV